MIALKRLTAVVIGVGGAGTQIAFRAWAFGMSVIGVDPNLVKAFISLNGAKILKFV